MPSSPLVFWDIVEESLDEAEFLWHRREGALDAHDRTLNDVEIWVEGRLLGALDGLVVAGAAGVERLLVPGLDSEDLSRVAVSAYALMASGTAQGIQVFKTAFLGAADERLVALRRGFELVPGGVDALAPAMKDAPPPVLAAFLDACAFERRPPGQEIGDLLTSRSAPVQRAATRLLRFATDSMQRTWFSQSLGLSGLSDPTAREIAVESYLIAGFPQARAFCRDLAAAEIQGSARMLLLLAMVGSAADHKLVLAALGSEARQADAIWALGFGGRKDGADACIELLSQKRHEKLAAEAFCAITGLDLYANGLLAPPPPEPDEIPFEQEDLDANLAPGPEDLLPMPDTTGVLDWWTKERPRFNRETRYLAGRPATRELLHKQLMIGPMRRRHAMAVEFAVGTRGRVQVETRAWVPEQRQQMAAFPALPSDLYATSGRPPIQGKNR
jgi:uncharacterized protein (TIGR02270 family)